MNNLLNAADWGRALQAAILDESSSSRAACERSAVPSAETTPGESHIFSILFSNYNIPGLLHYALNWQSHSLNVAWRAVVQMQNTEHSQEKSILVQVEAREQAGRQAGWLAERRAGSEVRVISCVKTEAACSTFVLPLLAVILRPIFQVWLRLSLGSSTLTGLNNCFSLSLSLSWPADVPGEIAAAVKFPAHT